MAQVHDITRLKAGVSIVDVLIHYGLFDGLRPDRDDLVGTCPLPGHGGDRSNRGAFRVTPAAGLWHCFTSCGGGDVVDLVRQLEGCDVAAAVRKLVQIEAGVPHSGTMPPISLVSQPAPFKPFTKTLALEITHPFLAAKGIRPDTAAHFEAGGWSLGGFLEGCVGVRLHDLDGNPLGYTGRRLNPKLAAAQGKWKVPPGLPKSDLLFNWHRARPHLGAGLVVVEGPFDAMKVHQAGFPGVVALLGTDCSPAQHRLLAQAGRVVLMLDGDSAGRTALVKIAKAASVLVETVGMPDGKGPADLDEGEIQGLLNPLFSS